MKRYLIFVSWGFLFILIIFSSCKKGNYKLTRELPKGIKVSKLKVLYDKVFGGSGKNDDELASGMVADNSGNMYVSMNVTTMDANKNIIVVRINNDGSLGWAKVYDSGGNELSPDSGENGETGGTAGSISMDSNGYIYVVGTSDNKDMGSAIFILKINPSNGTLVWQKFWKPKWPAQDHYPTGDQDAEGYAIDATGQYVYVTGTSGTNEIVLLALNKSDGSIVYQKGIDIQQGTKDRGYAIKQASDGSVFIGGVDGAYAIIVKVNGANTNSPSLAWVKKAGLPYGARINDIDIDASGVYYSCDIRGVNTEFVAMKTDFNGSVKWAKSFSAKSSDKNKTHVVYLNKDYLWIGGQITEKGLDNAGDALIAKVDKNSGVLKWSAIYYTGKGRDKSTGQRVKGIAIVNGNIYLAGQIYPEETNSDHYYGEWLKSKEWTMEDFSVSPSAVASPNLINYDKGEVRDANFQVSDYSVGKLQDSKDKKTSYPPDADVFLMKIQQK